MFINLEIEFDRISFRFYLNWVKVLYSGVIRVNGYTSEQFNLKRGTCQGFPLSLLLFATSIEPLAEMIRENPRICGISDGGESHKISSYTGNVILYINDPLTSIPTLV